MKKILIVDDRAEIRELVSMSLAREKDLELRQAKNGQEAIALITDDIPDLVLLDVLMPEMDGYEVTRRLKSDPRTEHCKIILLTAMGQKVDYERGIKAGADAYVIKPFSPQELVSKVRSILKD